MSYTTRQLVEFVTESNRIEGITRAPLDTELAAHEKLWNLDQITVDDLVAFVRAIEPTFKVNPLRRKPGMDVRIGSHRPPDGGPGIEDSLNRLLAGINAGCDPYPMHVTYETLHPFMDGNGRSGRALWVWNMLKVGRDPFSLPFLHRWYYESLSNAR